MVVDPDNPESENTVGTPAPPPDTAQSMSYFPTFPGSYWVYDNGDSATIADEYQLCNHYQTYIPSWWYPVSEPPPSYKIYTPIYNGILPFSGQVRNYTFYPSGYNGTTSQIFSEYSLSWSNHPYSEVSENWVITKQDTLMDVLGTMTEVCIVRKHSETIWADSVYNSDPAYWGEYYYFAKDIGIFKKEHRAYPDSSTVYTKTLVEYFVND